MNDTLTHWLLAIPGEGLRWTLRKILAPLADRYATRSLSTAGLAIKAAASALVKTGSAAWYGMIQGKLHTIAASTDMPALVGTITADMFNVYCFFRDAAGVNTVAMGTEGASLAGVNFPPIPQGKVLIGFIIVNPTGTGDFVGGTTALDNATVVPNVAYINVDGPFDPSILL